MSGLELACKRNLVELDRLLGRMICTANNGPEDGPGVPSVASQGLGTGDVPVSLSIIVVMSNVSPCIQSDTSLALCAQYRHEGPVLDSRTG